MSLKNKKFYRKKRYLIPMILIIVILVIRLALPTIVKNYVNNVLSDIPDYNGHVDDIDIGLIRGAYVIHGLYLNKVDADSEVPFIKLPVTDISVQWNALFKGGIVGEIILTDPELTYTAEDQGKEEESAAEVEDWTKALTDLVPISINRLEVVDGKVAFVELTAEPSIDIDMHGINLVATNLRNVVLKDRELPSDVDGTAISVGDGTVTLNGKMNLVKEIPDMDMAFSLEKANVTALNDFTEHYAGVDFAEGEFNLYSEMAIADGYLTGYVKPLLKDSKLISKEDGPLRKIWEGFVGFFKTVLKNQRTDTFGTKIPIEGDLNGLGPELVPSVINIFKNGWIQAFRGATDNEVDFQDAELGADGR